MKNAILTAAILLLALTTSAFAGSIVAWGRNDFGQCNVTDPNGFIAIAAGKYHTLGLKDDGTACAWGDNDYGQCNVPAPNSGFVAIAAGQYHSLGLKEDGSVAAWGDNFFGQLNVPAPNSSFIAIAGGGYHSLGLKEDGSVAAWGKSHDGQLNVPAPNSGFIAIAAGKYHSLGLKDDGSVAAWGWNGWGQCNVPAPNSGFIAIAGYYHSLGLKDDGSVAAWGRNDFGQCNVTAPNSGFVAIAAGRDHSLGLKDNGSVAAWGWNDAGQLNVPAPNSSFIAIAAGYRHSLALAAEPSTPPVEMVVIPGGEFEMGDHFEEGASYELPLHTVLLDSFFMSKCKITNHQYCDYLNSALGSGSIYLSSNVVYGTGNNQAYCNTSTSSSYSQIVYSDGVFSVRTKPEVSGRDMSNDPMVEISWYGAVAHCNWKSTQEGYDSCYNLSTWECDFSKHGYRLATEAEWEYAARGGLSGKRFPWADPNISHSQANYYSRWEGGSPYFPYDVSPTSSYHPDWNDGIYPYTAPVGSFFANGYGLYDMSGNVQEWCNDLYGLNYYNVSPYDNPQGPDIGFERVVRNGSWLHYAYLCRVAKRSLEFPNDRNSYVGFRIVRDSEPTNSPPVADAGDGQIIYLCADDAAQIELDGSGSTDADGDELEYLWTWEIEGTLFDANGVSPIIELPVGLHTIELTVDDGVEVSEPNSCVIEVIEGIEVDLRVMPRVINRKSRMTRILAVVQLPAGIDGDDIDGSFWLYPGQIEPSFSRLMTVNGSQKFFMVFDKSLLLAAVPANGPVVLEIEAQLTSGQCLYGSDRIRIIRRGQGPKEQTGRRKRFRFRRN